MGCCGRAVNFSKAVVKHVSQGMPRVQEDVIAERFEICKKCPDRHYEQLEGRSIPIGLRKIGEVGICNHVSCGCYLHATKKFPNKLGWNSTNCPMGHWKPVEKEQ